MFSLKKAEQKGRPGRTALGSFEEHEEPEEQRVAVVGFDKERGAKVADETAQPKKPEPVVVQPRSNENWMDTVKRRVYVPSGAGRGVAADEEDGKDVLKYGLNPVVKTGAMTGQGGPGPSDDDDYEELPQLTEQEAYQKDLDSRPDAPDMDAYSRVPVEEFGAALLRGMGVTETAASSEQMQRRPAMLGLGAKHVPHQVNELGSWGKGESRQASRREQKAYVPVAMIDKKTGKKVSEPDEERDRETSSNRERDRSRDSHRHRDRHRRRERDRRYKRDDRHRRRSRSPRR